MAKLPPIKRFIQDDFTGISEISTFAGKLFYPLNLFLNAVYSALNSGLTLNDNTIGLVTQSSNITSDANGLAVTTINWPYPQSPPQGVVVMNCAISTDPAKFPILSWSYASGVVRVSMQFVTMSSGAVVAAATNTYNLTFWVSGG